MLPAKTLAALFAFALLFSWGFFNLPTFLLGIYGVASLISFGAYAKDKAAARDNTWRVPEAHLHLVDVLGGWPGGLVAQDLLRHKTSKTSFQVVFWMTVVVNIAGLFWMWARFETRQ